MFATAFGAYGVLGIAMLYTGILFTEYGLRLYLQLFGWVGLCVGTITVALASYAYVVYGYVWLVEHIGEIATLAASALLAIVGLLFVYHSIAWVLQTRKRS